MKRWYFELWNDECKSRLPFKSVNSISVRSIRDVRKRNLKRIILGHLNINSVRNKFDLLVEQIKGKVDIMVISETKGWLRLAYLIFIRWRLLSWKQHLRKKQISYIKRTIENFRTINSGKILFPVYQLKILELTVMAWKSFCKYVLRPWMNLHHKRKSIPEETICDL